MFCKYLGPVISYRNSFVFKICIWISVFRRKKKKFGNPIFGCRDIKQKRSLNFSGQKAEWGVKLFNSHSNLKKKYNFCRKQKKLWFCYSEIGVYKPCQTVTIFSIGPKIANRRFQTEINCMFSSGKIAIFRKSIELWLLQTSPFLEFKKILQEKNWGQRQYCRPKNSKFWLNVFSIFFMFH